MNRLFTILGVLLLTLFIGCSYKVNKDSGEDTISLSGWFTSLDTAVFQKKCVTCHDPAGPRGAAADVDLTSYKMIMSQPGLIKKGDPNHSAIYLAVANKRMPREAPPLSDAEINTIGAWILAGAPETKGDVNLGNPTPTPTPTPPVVVTPTFSFVFHQIVEPKCLRCHSQPTKENGNTDLSNYKAIVDNEVIAGDPSLSDLYSAVTNSDPAHRMPKGDPPLSADELKAIQGWIQAGALNN